METDRLIEILETVKNLLISEKNESNINIFYKIILIAKKINITYEESVYVGVFIKMDNPNMVKSGEEFRFIDSYAEIHQKLAYYWWWTMDKDPTLKQIRIDYLTKLIKKTDTKTNRIVDKLMRRITFK